MSVPEAKTERNEIIVGELENRTSNIMDLSKRFGISRQRVSEIYYKATGKHSRYLERLHRDEQREARELKKHDVKFTCESCGKPVKKKDAGRRYKYCKICNKKSQKQRRDMNITLMCQSCRRNYHPYRSKRTMSNYCSRRCYHEGMKKKPKWMYKDAEKVGD